MDYPDSVGTKVGTRVGWRTWLDASAAISMTAAACVLIYFSFFPASPKAPLQPTLSAPREPQTLEGAQIEGNVGAPVAIIEYSDFQCPFCGAFARDTLPKLRSLYFATDKAFLAFRNFPLQIHPRAEAAAEAGVCAAQQGKFWAMHDLLFGNQADLTDASMRASALATGIDIAKFNRCMATAAPVVGADVLAATRIGLSGTPAFFFGRVAADGRVVVSRVLSGSRPLKDFRTVVDELLR